MFLHFLFTKRTHPGNEADDRRGQRREPHVVASHDQHGIDPRLQLRHLHHAQSAQIRPCIYQVSKWTIRLKTMHVTIVNFAGFKVKFFFRFSKVWCGLKNINRRLSHGFGLGQDCPCDIELMFFYGLLSLKLYMFNLNLLFEKKKKVLYCFSLTDVCIENHWLLCVSWYGCDINTLINVIHEALSIFYN